MRLNLLFGIFVGICIVQVHCVSDSENEENLNAADKSIVKFACERSKLQVVCPKGQVINIDQAIYGRVSNLAKCNPNKNNKFNTKCRSSKSLTVMRQRCHLKQGCSVDATNSVFGDPCPKTIKYLEIRYRCVAERVPTKITNIKKTTPRATTPKKVATPKIPPRKVTPQPVTTSKQRVTTKITNIKKTTPRATTPKKIATTRVPPKKVTPPLVTTLKQIITTKITNFQKTTPRATTPEKVATTKIPPKKVTPQPVTTSQQRVTTKITNIQKTTPRATTPEKPTIPDTTLETTTEKAQPPLTTLTNPPSTTTTKSPSPTTTEPPSPTTTEPPIPTTTEPTSPTTTEPPSPTTTEPPIPTTTEKPRVTAPDTTCTEDDLDCIIDDLGENPIWFVCDKDIGSYPHPSSNKLFIFCLNWKPSVKRCGQNLIFSEDLMTCVSP